MATRLLAAAIGWTPLQVENALDNQRPLPDDVADALRLVLGSMTYLSIATTSAGAASSRAS